MTFSQVAGAEIQALAATANTSRFSGRAAREAQDNMDHQWPQPELDVRQHLVA